MLKRLFTRLRLTWSPPSSAVAADPTPNIVWHRPFLVAATILVFLYAVSVLYFARAVPEIGLHCAFYQTINGVDPEPKVRRNGNQPLPQVKDRVVQIGDRAVHNWPEFIQGLMDLHPDEVQARDPANLSGLTHIRQGDQELVLVQVQRHEDQKPTSVWCQVDRAPLELVVPSVAWFFLKIGLFGVGLLVYWQRPADRSAAQFFLLTLVTVGAYMGGYHWARIIPHPSLLVVFIVCAVLLPAVTLHFYLVFPRPKAWLECCPRGTLLAVYGVPVAFLAAILIGYLQARLLYQTHAEPATVTAALQGLLAWIYVYLVVASGWYLASVVCLVHSFRTAVTAIERNQVKWILFGSLAAAVPMGYSLALAIWAPDKFGSGAATWPMFAASACITVAFTVSITRYRLMQLDQIIGSGMVYFLISFAAGLAYYAVVFAGMLLVGTRVIAGPSLGQALMVSTTALVLTLVLDLARNRFKRALDRRFHRDKVHLDRTLQQMGKAIDQLVDPPTLARRLLQASAELLGVSRGSVYLREQDPPLYRLTDALGSPPPLTELAAGCPLVDTLHKRPALLDRPGAWGLTDPGQGQLRFLGGAAAQALTHEGNLLAILVLGPKDAGPYSPDDLNLLAALAQITALALENAERHRTIEGLNRDLQAKVEKISEQQRRILALQSQLIQVQSPKSKVQSPESADGDFGHETLDSGLEKGGIVGSSPVIRQLLQSVRKVAASPSTVLIRGESGTGKELLAQALHEHSPRAGKAFVKVHCAALSPGLLESELFGHVKGAFTGAHRDKVGRFELAHGGTLFLDEIGDVSLEVQTKLLRVLQEKTIERVGSSESVPVDVRVIAATNQDLEQLIDKGRFRGDLFYRLNVISMVSPSLRERREDIPELAMHFLRLYAQRCGVPLTEIDDEAMLALKAFSWPGNVRQLENVIEGGVVMAEGSTLTLRDLPPELLPAGDDSALPEVDDEPEPILHYGIHAERVEREQGERERLVRALAAARGNKAEAARALGLARSTLLSRLKKHGLS